MKRSINDQFGFADRYTTNENIMRYNEYPIQDTNIVGKYIAINFLDYNNQSFNYRVRVPRMTYREYQGIFPKTYDPSNNLPIIFRIVRYDLSKPGKAILVSIYGHLIVTTTEKLDAICYCEDLSYCRIIKKDIENLDKQMYIPTTVNTEQEFIEALGDEYIHVFPIQSDIIYGRRVWIEFEQDVQKIPYNPDTAISRNQYEFTDEMAAAVIERDVSLKNVKREQLESFPVYHNIHKDSFVDNPRRSIITGYVVRADVDCPDGQVVVLHQDRAINKYICLDEAKFFYDTEDTRKINISIPAQYSKRSYTLYNYIYS